MERFTGARCRSYGLTCRFLCTFIVFLTLAIYILCEDTLEDDSCYMYDTCKVKQFFRTCSCESDCYRYGTCCRDAPEFDNMRNNSEQFLCYSEGTPSPVFAKRACSDEWEGDQAIQEGCLKLETVNTTTDFMSQVLVSSNMSEVTYWNWNCALCNGEDIHDLMFWTVQVSCFVNGLKSHLSISHAKENMAYNESGRHWGILTEGQIFIPCSVSFFQPAFLMGRLRLCAPNIISSCPSTWKDGNTRRKCLSYHGERKYRKSGTYFKNVHCAKCNGVGVSDLECFGRNYRSDSSVEDSRVMKVVFNLNSWTGEHGEAGRDCRIKSRRYDPFLRICRDLSLGVTNATQGRYEDESLNSTGKVPSSMTFIFGCLIVALLFQLGK